MSRLFVIHRFQGYKGERNTDPNISKMLQAKLGLDRNANKKKKKKKVSALEEGPSKATQLFCVFPNAAAVRQQQCAFSK